MSDQQRGTSRKVVFALERHCYRGENDTNRRYSHDRGDSHLSQRARNFPVTERDAYGRRGAPAFVFFACSDSDYITGEGLAFSRK
jgi:hypothetical protein